jgi:hypothetical protein
MNPPFSADQFFEVFVHYNEAVWPTQVLLVLMALVAVLLAFLRPPWHGKAIGSILGALWIWTGAAYHWAFFAQINPAARWFGAAFVLEGLLLIWLIGRSSGIRFQPGREGAGLWGGFFIAYGLVIYPLLGIAQRHVYPAQPTFGLPCPTTIFTIGMLLWARFRVPRVVWVVPVTWSIVASSAVRSFGVWEDAMLPVAALVAMILVLRPRAEVRTAGPAPT